MEILLALAFLLLCGLIYVVIEFWWVLVIIIAVVGIVALILWIAYNKSLDRVVSAEIIGKEPIVERQAENTGYSIGYGRHLSSREYYRYRNVITGYEITFKVRYADGKQGIIKCRENSATYNKLITLAV